MHVLFKAESNGKLCLQPTIVATGTHNRNLSHARGTSVSLLYTINFVSVCFVTKVTVLFFFTMSFSKG